VIPSAVEQPGGRAPAPGGLAAVQLLVNSVDLEDGTDRMATVAGMREWLGEVGLPAAGLRDADRLLLIRLREAIRDFVDARDDPAHPAPEQLAPLVEQLALEARFEGGAFRLAGTTPVGRTAAPVVDAVRTAMADGTWPRLKVCERDTCRWLFFDHSRNANSRWCASSVCGSREKSRRAYARRTARS
jgi:predicted RNA-binding Zn ribbon-like protein